MPRVAKKVQNERTRALYAALKRAFPALPDTIADVVYQYNPVSVRVRVVDDRFAELDLAQRERLVRRALKGLPEEVTGDISMILTMTPEEAAHPAALLSQEFDDPNGSRL